MSIPKPPCMLAVLLLAVLPFASQASVADAVRAGTPAERVIAQSLAEGRSVEAILDDIARIVGSSAIGRFAASTIRTLAIATDTDPAHAGLTAAIYVAIGRAAARGHEGTTLGQRYASEPATFQTIAIIEIQNRTGVLPLATAAPAATHFATPVRTPRVSARRTGSEQDALDAALCRSLGNQPGCL